MIYVYMFTQLSFRGLMWVYNTYHIMIYARVPYVKKMLHQV